MVQLSAKAQKIMTERFGKDTTIALATTENGMHFHKSLRLTP